MSSPADVYRRMQREAAPQDASMAVLLRVLVDSILRGRSAMEAGDLATANRHFIAAQQVLHHLGAGIPETLGEVGQNLKDLYAWSELQLGKANISHDTGAVDAVATVLANIRDGFEGIQGEAKEAVK